MRLHHLAFAGFLFITSNAALTQDDLIDDLPKERKEAIAKESPRRAATKKPKTAQKQTPQLDAENPPLPSVPNTDLIDDRSPEQKQAAAEHNATRKTASAIPDNLADAIARALHNSPTILVADAKVRQAQAELTEVRLNVTHEVTLAFQRRTSNKRLVDRYEAADSVGTLQQPELLEKARQAILEDESRIVYLLGIGAETADHAEQAESSAKALRPAAGGSGMGIMMPGGMGGAMFGGEGGMMPGGMMSGGMMPSGMGGMMSGGSAGRGSPRPSPAAKPEPALPEKLQKLLQARVDFDFRETPLGDVLDYLAQAVDGDVNFVGKEKLANVPVTLNLKQVTLESGLQAIADLSEHCFILRDYGILVLNSNDARSYERAGILMIGPGLPTRRPKP